MTNFELFFPENLYHSYVIQGDPNIIAKDLFEYFIKKKIIYRDSPDLFQNKYTTFSIDDSKVIKEWFFSKETIGNKKFCILGVDFINREAEKSLLKILEEPRQNTHFFIISPNVKFISETILSRVQLIILDEKEEDLINRSEAIKFVNASLSQRLEIIAQMIKKNDNSTDSGEIRVRALKLVNEIEREIYIKKQGQEKSFFERMALEELHKARVYLNSSGSSPKMILESLALIIEAKK